MLATVPTVEIDAWLRYTQWNVVLEQSKHNIIETYTFACEPDVDEPELARVLRTWNRIVERGLDTLAATDHKDTLKWWRSPKNEAASQRPFELPQNAKTITKYSAIWAQFICYMICIAPRERWEDKTGR